MTLTAQNAVPVASSGLLKLMFSHAQALLMVPPVTGITLDLESKKMEISSKCYIYRATV